MSLRRVYDEPLREHDLRVVFFLELLQFRIVLSEENLGFVFDDNAILLLDNVVIWSGTSVYRNAGACLTYHSSHSRYSRRLVAHADRRR